METKSVIHLAQKIGASMQQHKEHDNELLVTLFSFYWHNLSSQEAGPSTSQRIKGQEIYYKCLPPPVL